MDLGTPVRTQKGSRNELDFVALNGSSGKPPLHAYDSSQSNMKSTTAGMISYRSSRDISPAKHFYNSSGGGKYSPRSPFV